MRRVMIFIFMISLTGCAWLGFGDDSGSSASDESTVTSEPVAEEVSEATQATPAATKQAPAVVKGAKNEAQIKAALDAKGKQLAAQSARTLVPNKSRPEYKQSGSQWVAKYIDVDSNNVVTQLVPGKNGLYTGKIRYQEKFMECTGATKQAALKGDCRQVGSRNVTELIRYNGKIWED